MGKNVGMHNKHHSDKVEAYQVFITEQLCRVDLLANIHGRDTYVEYTCQLMIW